MASRWPASLAVLTSLIGFGTHPAGSAPTPHAQIKQKNQELAAAARHYIEVVRETEQSAETFNQQTTQEVATYRRASNPPPAATLDKMDDMLGAHAEAVRAQRTHLESYEAWVLAGFPTTPSTVNVFEREHNARLDQLISWFKTWRTLQRHIDLDMRRLAARQSKTLPVRLAGNWTGVYTQIQDDAPLQVAFQAKLTQTGEQLQGRITEPNKFDDDGKVLLLESTIKNGVVIADYVDFDKEYSGAGNYTQTVHYTGSLNETSGVLSGNWFLDERQGPFRMQRAR